MKGEALCLLLMHKQISVAAIQNGTVIDHIPAGQGIKIVRRLKLTDHKKTVTLGLNLVSTALGYKDLIKLEERELSEEEAGQVAIFAPKATLNIIRDFAVVKKSPVTLPSVITKILRCQNGRCITHHEEVVTRFYVERTGGQVMLHCHYCQKGFLHDRD